MAGQSCAMVRRWQFFASFMRPVFPASCLQHISNLHSKFALMCTMCRSMVDIHSATMRLGEEIKERRREQKPLGKNSMSASAMQGSHSYFCKEKNNIKHQLLLKSVG